MNEDAALYKAQMLRSLNMLGYLATDVMLSGNIWIANVRGEGWRPVMDLLAYTPTRVPNINNI